MPTATYIYPTEFIGPTFTLPFFLCEASTRQSLTTFLAASILCSCVHRQHQPCNHSKSSLFAVTLVLASHHLAFFSLYSSIRRGSTVVYCAGKLGIGYVFKDKQIYEFVWEGSGRDGTPIKISATGVRRLVEDPATVFICDGVMPPVVKATTLLITSPLKVVWHEFLKSVDCRMLYFPMFSKEEILQCRASCFSSP